MSSTIAFQPMTVALPQCEVCGLVIRSARAGFHGPCLSCLRWAQRVVVALLGAAR